MAGLEKKNISDILPLTPLQAGMLYHHRVNPGADHYFEQLSLGVSGDLDEEAFERAWNVVIQSNEALRALFRWEKVENPVQVILKEHSLDLRKYDLSGESPEVRSLRLREIRESDREETFDLRRVPFRVTLCKLETHRYEIIVSHHHILYDGWSNGIVFKEFFQAYNRLCRGSEPVLGVKPSFKQHIRWLRRQDAGVEASFWKDYFKDFHEPVELSIKQRGDNAGSDPDEWFHPLPDDLKEKLFAYAKEHKLTGAALFYTAWAILLQRYNDTSDVVFGIAVSGRNSGVKDIEKMVGLFINTLPLRVLFTDGDTVASLVGRVNDRLKDITAFEASPPVRVKEHAGWEGVGELFDTLMVVENYPLDISSIFRDSGLSLDSHVMSESTHYDLTAGVLTGENAGLKMIYNSAVLDRTVVSRLGEHYFRILDSLPRCSHLAVSELSMMSEEERREVLEVFNRPGSTAPVEKSLHRLFQEQVDRAPDSVALVGPGNQIVTYGCLNSISGQLAGELNQRGIGRGDIVGLMIHRSLEMIAGILGILKTGAAYLPIEPDSPRDRIDYIQSDANISLTLTAENINIHYSGMTRHAQPAVPENVPGNAYIIYTSGSTGRPKGVLVEHCSAVNTVLHFGRQYGIRPGINILQTSSYTFDASIDQIFGSLLHGAALHIVTAQMVLDIPRLREYIRRHNINLINFVPHHLYELLGQNEKLPSLHTVISGAEPLDDNIKNAILQKGYRLYNHYGPTETAVDALISRCDTGSPVLLGHPLPNTSVYVLDSRMRPVPVGVPGELYIAGAGVARGYLNNPELTAGKFVNVHGANLGRHTGLPLRHVFRTGDRGCWTGDGNIRFLGRMDQQVKIRGFRIELEEIEKRIMEHPGVNGAIVVKTEDAYGGHLLCAYIVPEKERQTDAPEETLTGELSEYLSQSLPYYMVPSLFMLIEKIPRHPGGKIDRHLLPAPQTAPRDYHLIAPPRTPLEIEIAQIWKALLNIDEIGIDDEFFRFGGNSFMLIKCSQKLEKELGRPVPVVMLFRFPTIRTLARHLEGEGKSRETTPGKRPETVETVGTVDNSTDIAIIGMAGRFPGADSVAQFWENLVNGVCSISRFSREELETAGVPQHLLDDPAYVGAKGILSEIESFDAAFFDYSPRQALKMDPQSRLFHEVCWQALDDAGCNPYHSSGRTGLYAGAGENIKWLTTLASAAGSPSEQYEIINLNSRSFASLVAYKLNLNGPSVTINTACSTSLVAVDAACQGLIRGQCDVALAGGTFVLTPHKTGYLYQEGMILSSGGVCRAFDASADGIVSGEGVGVVVLKKLQDAIQQRDQIYAVIKGSAVNNDGNRKTGYSAPSVEGQAEVIREALGQAGVDPDTVSYIETHGTGTPLGDPVEVEGLKLAFNTGNEKTCGIGSLKTNVGHLDAAAGVAGLIKAALVVKHRVIPPSLHFKEPNPQIDFKNSPFYVVDRLTRLEKGGKKGDRPIRVGVSSFGIGGTNCHVVLEEPVRQKGDRPEEEKGDRPGNHLLLLSAKTPAALGRAAENLVRYFEENPGAHLEQVAYTLHAGRHGFPFRHFEVVSDIPSAAARLRDAANNFVTAPVHEQERQVVFMFSGQGSQYTGMGRDLYRDCPAFRDALDRCFEILDSISDENFKEILFSSQDMIHQTLAAQPLLFIFEYALSQLLIHWGVRPGVMIGHSIGEYVAAHLAGVFSLEDALKLVVERGRLMQGMPAGDMLGIPLPEEQLTPMLPDDISMAAINSSLRCVVSGPADAITEFEKKLVEMDISCRRLHTSHAFHSGMMDPVLEPFLRALDKITLNPPQKSFISNITGTIAGQEVTDPRYWVNHLRGTVRFADGIRDIAGRQPGLFLEVGPGNALSTFVRQHREVPQGSPHRVFNLLRHPKEKVDDYAYLLERIGQIWLQGYTVDGEAFYRTTRVNRISLPPYPFEPSRFPVDDRIFNAPFGFAAGSTETLPPGTSRTGDGVPPVESVPMSGRSGLVAPYVPPRSPEERQLAGIWEEFFGIRPIGLKDDFYQLGGDSLKAITLVSLVRKAFDAQLTLADVFSEPTVEGMARYVGEKDRGERPDIIPTAPEQEFYPLSPAQKRIFLLSRMDPMSAAYNMPLAALLEGSLDRRKIENTVNRLIQRHESLRTSFHLIDSQPVQRIHEHLSIEIEYKTDAGALSFIRPFDLSQPPLLRVGLTGMEKGRHLLVLDVHHIISDGMSSAIFIDEFMTLYSGGNLEALTITYKDYAHWWGDETAKSIINEQESFWLEQFQGELPVIELPCDYPRPPVWRFEGNVERFEIGQPETSRLKEIAKSGEGTLFTVLLAAWNVLLHRLSGVGDIVVGTGSAGRGRVGQHRVIGMFVNTLALRNFPHAGLTFNQFFRQVKERALTAFENQDYPFEELVDKLGIQRNTGRNPLFDTALIHQNVEIPEIRLPGLKFKQIPLDNTIAKFDLTLESEEREEQLHFRLEYCTALFKQATIKRISGYFKNILSGVIENPGLLLEAIDFIPPEEKQLLLEEFNHVNRDYPLDTTVDRLFRDQVERTPDHIAVIFDHQHLTYRELDRYSDGLACNLLERGVQPRSIVAVNMPRSIRLIIALLGILKTRSAYLPIDPQYPRERIEFILADSNAQIQLTHDDITPSIKMGTVRSVTSVPTDVIYIIYTSGTTGRPKGVSIRHDGVVNLIHAHREVFGEAPGIRSSQVASPAFDATASEVWPCLTSGAAVDIAPGEVRMHPLEMRDWLIRRGIDLSFQSTAMAEQLFKLDWHVQALALKKLRTGGDRLNLYPPSNCPFRVYNLYGPTEDTVCTTYVEITNKGDRPEKTGAERIGLPPIGRPIANHRVFVLDKYDNLQPMGVAGELCVSGVGLAEGYLNRQELTGEKFVFIQDLSRGRHMGLPIRCFKTGDLVRWRKDGELEFLGRIDDQVKIRGFRIELGEIEHRLLHHPQIKEAAVIARTSPNNDKYLCAYFVSIPTASDAPDMELEILLKKFLSKTLPDYMIPAFFIPLEKIPLTPNGKIDRRALPAPRHDAPVQSQPPRDTVERQLAQTWARVLDVPAETIRVADNFFKRGGHSLKAAVMLSEIHESFNVRLDLRDIFKHPTLEELAILIREGIESEYIPIPTVEVKEFYNLSSTQLRLYLLSRMEDNDSIAYNMPAMYKLTGKLDIQKLQQVFKTLLQRHESFRTSFVTIDENPVQVIHANVEFTIREYSSSYDQYGQYDLYDLYKSFLKPFDLSSPPLLRVGLIAGKEDTHFLMVDIHHIISDGVSMGVLIREFMDLYNGVSMPPLTHRYIDYTGWRASGGTREFVKKQESYWLEQLGGEIPVLNLPTDYPRPAVQSFEGSVIEFRLEAHVSNGLRELASQQNCTLFILMNAVFSVFLSRLSGQEDIVIGTPVANRRHADLQNIIGMFVNALALRNYPSGGKTFLSFLEEVGERTLSSIDNQEYPFNDLVEKIILKRDAGRNPVFDVMFSMQNMDIPDIRFPGLTLTYVPMDVNIAKFDLTLTAADNDSQIYLTLEYCTRLFKKETVKRFTGYYKQLVESILGAPRQTLSQLEIIPPLEKHRLLEQFNNNACSYDHNKTLPQLFKTQVDRRPHVVAAAGPMPVERGLITYRELDRLSGGLARLLRVRGVNRQQVVGIMLEPSVEMAIAIWAVLKAGGAYLPVAPGIPAARKAFMLKDSSARLLISHPSVLEKTPAAGFGWPDEKIIQTDAGQSAHGAPGIEPVNQPGDAAYIIYTSGTTGNPKGAVVEHRNVNNLVAGLNEKIYKRYESYETLKVALLAPYFFDASVQQIFGALLQGHTLEIAANHIKTDGLALVDFYNRQGIDISDGTPAHIRIMAESAGDDNVSLPIKHFIIGGEALPAGVVEKFLQRIPGDKPRITNIYGLTETCVDSTCFQVDVRGGHDRQWEVVPIGAPMANQQVYILDKYQHPQPVGVTGELYVGGDCVGRGYLNQPEMTASKFVCIQELSRGRHMGLPIRCFKTGDLARWLEDGSIEFLGRGDHQVKIRGYRIETGEIENCLLKHEFVREAVVVAKELPNNDKYLCAYVTTSDAPGIELDTRLKQFLAQTLPDYMIPAFFIPMEKIPLTANGKVDRRALPDPEMTHGNRSAAPRDELEQKLADTWNHVLGDRFETGSIGIQDDFFKLGGHSLTATILVSRVHKEFNVKMKLVDVFRYATLGEMARHIRQTARDTFAAVLPAEKREYYPLSPAQKRLYIIQQLKADLSAYNVTFAVRLEGDADIRHLEQVFRELIQRHAGLRTSFHTVNGEPFQFINDSVVFNLEKMGETGNSIKNFVRPFDLAKAPLVRAGVIPAGEAENILVVDMHHIISDGTSSGILSNDFMTLYNRETPMALPIGYHDYCVWLEQSERRGILKKQETYWLKRFSGSLPRLNLPYDFPRPQVQQFDGGSIPFEITTEQLNALKQLASRRNATLFMVLTAVFNVFLNKLCGQEDIIIGSPVANRRHADLQQIIGMFAATLPLRNFPAPHKTFEEFLDEVNTANLEAFEHQEYPLDTLVEKLGIQRDAARNPIFDVLFVLQNMEVTDMRIPGLKLTAYPYENRVSQFDMILIGFEEPRRVIMRFMFALSLFKEETVQRFVHYFEEILGIILDNPGITIGDIQISHDLVDPGAAVLEDADGDFDF